MDTFTSLNLFFNFIISIADNCVWLILLIGIVAMFITKRFNPKYKLPPGPVGIPFFGYYPFLGKCLYKDLHRLAMRYGPIFSMYLGRQLVVVVGSFRTAKEALTNKDLMDRPPAPANDLLPNSRSFATLGGDVWKEQKQFILKVLRQLGMGKQRMENIIQEEIQHLLEHFSGKENTPLNIEHAVTASVSNNIYVLLTGRRLDLVSEERKFLNEFLHTLHLNFRPTAFHAIFPGAKYWFYKFKLLGFHTIRDIMLRFENLMNEKVTSCRNNIDNDEQSYIRDYLKSMSTNTSSFSERILRGNLSTLLGAGSEPPSVTILWALALVSRFLEMQRKVQDEIDRVVGSNVRPTSDHQASMPYTSALLMEVQRYVSVIPVSPTRCAACETKVCGYDIPKGTWIMPNIWGIHHNLDYWAEPGVFNPERFIRDGKLIRHPSLIPFSYGARSCPGTDLGKQLVFLYVTSILQKYTVLPKKNMNTFKESNGIVRLIFPEVCLVPRKGKD